MLTTTDVGILSCNKSTNCFIFYSNSLSISISIIIMLKSLSISKMEPHIKNEDMNKGITTAGNAFNNKKYLE